jgi:protein-tyrosine phosphatase
VFDIHLHILANVDDGPADRSVSASMLQLALSLGFDRIVATPHLHEPASETYLERIAEEQEWLSQQASEIGIGIGFGFEVKLTPDIGARLESGEPISWAGSRTVLVELPFAGWPAFTDQALFDIASAGFRPLLAHPERYSAVLDNSTLIYGLKERGVLMQITTGSLAGLFGRQSQQVAERFVRDGIVDVLASDAHSAGRRYVSVNEGLARAVELVGPERVRQMTTDNPAALIEDRELAPAEISTSNGHHSTKWRQSLTRAKQLVPRR